MTDVIEIERLRKLHYRALERLFSAEIDGHLPLKSKAAIFKELERMGYAQHGTENIGGRFAVTVSGWYLTHAGRLTYCMNCKNTEEP